MNNKFSLQPYINRAGLSKRTQSVPPVQQQHEDDFDHIICASMSLSGISASDD